MKLLFIAAFLAMVFGFANAKRSFKDAGNTVIANNRGFKTFADVAKAVVQLNAEEKKKFAEGAADSLEDKSCMEQLRPVFVRTSKKYLDKMVKGEPWYKKDGKEFSFGNFISHSGTFKTATNTKCVDSLMKSLGKAVQWGCKAAFGVLIASAMG